MSFEEIDTIGDHKIFKYDISNHDFIHFFINLYKEKNLDQLHLKSENYNLLKSIFLQCHKAQTIGK